MTFDEKELDNAINKIIVTSLFSCLCDADELPEKIRKQLADALRVRLYAVNLFVAGMTDVVWMPGDNYYLHRGMQ